MKGSDNMEEFRQKELELEKVGNGKICVQCGQFRDRSQYRKHGKALDGLTKVCTVCNPLKIEKKQVKFQEIKPEPIPTKQPVQKITIAPKSNAIRISLKTKSGTVTFESEFGNEPLEIKIERK